MARRALVVFAVTAAVAAGLALVGVQVQRRRAEAALVSDFAEVAPLPGLRPSHVTPPVEGTVGSLLETSARSPHPTFPETWARGEPEACAAARVEAALPLPAACAEVIDAQTQWAQRVLASTRASDSTLTEWLESAGARGALHSANRAAPEVLAMQVVSHDIRRAAKDGRASESLDWCADGLGLGRDFALRLGPEGLKFASHWAVLLAAPCTEAALAATPEARQKFAQAVDAISATLPPDRRTVRQAVTAELTGLYGGTFGDDTLGQLPPAVVADIKARSPAATRFPSPFLLRQFAAHAQALRSSYDAVEQGPAPRRAAFARAQERLRQSWSSRLNERELGLDALFDRVDRLRALLTLLKGSAEHGETTAKELTHAVRLHRDGEAALVAPSPAP